MTAASTEDFKVTSKPEDHQVYSNDLCSYWLNIINEIGYRPRTAKTKALLLHAARRFREQATLEYKLSHVTDADYWIQIAEHCENYASAEPIINNNNATAYIGFNIAKEISQLAEKIGRGPIQFLKNTLNAMHNNRVMLSRSTGLMNSVIAELPANFMSIDNAKGFLKSATHTAGILSWAVFYARLGLNLFLLIKHTVIDSWLNTEEQAINWQQRLATQWNLKKFLILNDLIFATLNLACFFWLVGTGLLGQIGGYLTAAFMIVDIGLTLYRFHDERVKHQKLLDELEAIQSKTDAIKQEIANIKKELNYLGQKRFNELLYLTGTAIGFLMMSSVFLPAQLLPAVLSFLPVVGAVIMLLSVVAFGFLNNKTEQNKLQGMFDSTDNPLEKKYYQALMQYQKIENIKQTINNILMPTVSFICLLCLPIPPIASIFVAIGCMMALCMLINFAFGQKKPTRDSIIAQQADEINMLLDNSKIEYRKKDDYLELDEDTDCEKLIQNLLNKDSNKFYLIYDPFQKIHYYNLENSIVADKVKLKDLTNEQINALVIHMNAQITPDNKPTASMIDEYLAQYIEKTQANTP